MPTLWTARSAVRSGLAEASPAASEVSGDYLPSSHLMLTGVAVTMLTAELLALFPWQQNVRELALGLSGVVALLLGALILRRNERAGSVSGLVFVSLIATGVLASELPSAWAGAVLPLLLLPLLWSALYRERWLSRLLLVVSASIALAVLVRAHSAYPAAARGTLLWVVAASALLMMTMGLRVRLERSTERSSRLSSELRLLENASVELTAVHDPRDVIATGLRWVAALVSPVVRTNRTNYLPLFEGTFEVDLDSRRRPGTWSWDLKDHPQLQHATLRPECSAGWIDARGAGPAFREVVEDLNANYAVWIPVRVDGQVRGAFSVIGRGGPLTSEQLETCAAVGRVIELAMANALAHEQLRTLATTDQLTGLANRRGFQLFAAARPGKRAFVTLSLDVDGLKFVNDTYGHARGDQLLNGISTALRSTLRRNDVLARMGGDEFAAFIFDASLEDGIRVAERMLGALASVDVCGLKPRLSIGIAGGDRNDPIEGVLEAADRAMYRAKRSGGMCYAIAESEPSEARETAAERPSPSARGVQAPGKTSTRVPRISRIGAGPSGPRRLMR